MAITKRDVAKLYVAMFNRAPEGEGLNNWYYAAIENGWDLGQLAQSMLNAAQQVVESDPAYETIYPQYVNVDTTDAASVRAIIETVYKILFNKDYNTDPQGIDGWVKSVVEDGQPLGNAIASITLAAEQILNDPNADAAAKAAAQAFENKIDVAEYTAQKFPTFTGDFEKFQKFVEVVNDDPGSIDAAKDLVEAYTPKIVNLTTTVD
ncbi:hypothetical protein NitYY0814_C1484 [Nitratiruptor sp. YY08-14]|nr:hypothetical protein [Nitratiruptor sp. YY08-14]BCD64632.1 hypothetical protein NitYY0814_C1484 [Nitratiruptor sp. YY08-14]